MPIIGLKLIRAVFAAGVIGGVMGTITGQSIFKTVKSWTKRNKNDPKEREYDDS